MLPHIVKTELSMQDQMKHLEGAMKMHQHAEAMMEKNANLKDRILGQQEQLKQLSKLALSSSTLADTVGTATGDAYTSAIAHLKAVKQLIPEGGEETQDHVKAIIAKLLNEVMNILLEVRSKAEDQVTIIEFLEIEEQFHQVLSFAEEKGILPELGDEQGWKANAKKHQGLMDRIKELLSEQMDE